MNPTNQPSRTVKPLEPEAIVFGDDGSIPNSKLPLLLYRTAFAPDTLDLDEVIEKRFAANNWTKSWRDTVFPFQHYHSTSHEVLGVYRGTATILLGGERGEAFEVNPGDIIVIPAGVGHKRLASRNNFQVVGAYPDGRDRDLLRGGPGERPQADRNIAAVPLPSADPVSGFNGPLFKLWKVS
jgi:uncharacterized protein YjlB